MPFFVIIYKLPVILFLAEKLSNIYKQEKSRFVPHF